MAYQASSGLQAVRGRAILIPFWVRSVVTSVGFAVATIRTMQDYRPSFDPSAVLDDPPRVQYVQAILSRMGLPPELINKVTIVVGQHNGLQGSSRSKPGPVLELTPQLAESLTRRTYNEVNMKSDVALALRVKTFHDKPAGSQVPVLCEFPFEFERQAVIAHEAAHLKLDHSSGLLRLNGMLAFSAAVFWVRPVYSIVPGLFYAFCSRLYTRHCEIAADRHACLTLGPEITQAMINRLSAKEKLDKLVLGKYSFDQPAFRTVVMEMAWNELFHIPLDKRLKALRELQKEQNAMKPL